MSTKRTSVLLAMLFVLAGAVCSSAVAKEGAEEKSADAITQGALRILDKEGKVKAECPLKHTSVEVEISGFIARVRVTQQFHNPFKEKIEAVYVFPLSQNSAVDDMVMKVGQRTIRGQIKRREEARRIYEDAKARGHVASLLDQERPNIFTQSVANIMPGEEVHITISYVEYLKYEDGRYEFSFPMVVGPRYIPGEPTSKVPEVSPEMKGKVVEVPANVPEGADEPKGKGWAPDTNKVPDASRITPPVIKEGMRAGHDISISVQIDSGGLPIQNLKSELHEIVQVQRGGPVEGGGFFNTVRRDYAKIHLKEKASIPNKDFILSWEVAGKDIADAVLTHRTQAEGGFFTLILQPPKHVPVEQITPKEMIFVIDKSGSMSGFPIEKAKETMKLCIERMNPDDTFNLMTFEGGVGFCFAGPVANTEENRKKALEYLADLQGSGGTEMMKAINACLADQHDEKRVRIVCFMTDGYVGNDMEIIDAVKKNAGTARVFAFGIGNSVNRFLLDNMARAGRGEVQYVTLKGAAEGAAERFEKRISSPLLTDISIDFADLPVADVYPDPKAVPDLFAAKPLIFKGRYTKAASGVVTLRGKVAGKPYERKIKLNLPEKNPAHDVLAALWAREKIAHIMSEDLLGIQRDKPKEEIKEAITSLGLEFRLVTQYTSFVAVEEMVITEGGKPRTIAVPVEMPEGVSYEGVFGKEYDGRRFRLSRGAGSGRALACPSAAYLHSYSLTEADEGERVMQPTEPPKEWSEEKKRDWYLERRLDESLHGLAEKVEKEGKDGNLKAGNVEVVDGKVKVAVWLSNDSDENLKKLNELGFETAVRSKAVKMLVGQIEVKKLEDLALLDFVHRIEPPPYAE